MQKAGDNYMKLKNFVSILGILLLLGCASVSQPRAVVADGIIQNASLGFSGFSFNIPDGFKIYNPAEDPEVGYTPLQELAIRVYELNEEWHPRGNELFYESFLLMSDQTCFLLITLKSDTVVQLNVSPFWDDASSRFDVMPCYNVTSTRSFELNGTRQPVVYTCGAAYEKGGWYYAKSKRNSTRFNYESCRIVGGNRDSYILMGFALPENAKALTAPMQQMVDEMKFGTP